MSGLDGILRFIDGSKSEWDGAIARREMDQGEPVSGPVVVVERRAAQLLNEGRCQRSGGAVLSAVHKISLFRCSALL